MQLVFSRLVVQQRRAQLHPRRLLIVSYGAVLLYSSGASNADCDSILSRVDELHPGEQADRIVAREIVKAINGSDEGGRWTTWFT